MSKQQALQAVIMDMAGTVIDFGSMAPVKAMCALFEQEGVPITAAEARIPMGTHKRDHIKSILFLPRVTEQWRTIKRSEPCEAVVDELYKKFIPLQVDVINQCADLIPGAAKSIETMQQKGLKLGSNTGYNREMMQAVLKRAKAQGYDPQSAVCVDDVSHGRPLPEMCLKNMLDLRVSSVQRCVKVDDSCVGIEEGLNAGMWTIGLAISGNETGLDLQEWQALNAQQQQDFRDAASQRLYQAGAHYVIDSIAQLPQCLEQIEARLQQGERP